MPRPPRPCQPLLSEIPPVHLRIRFDSPRGHPATAGLTPSISAALRLPTALFAFGYLRCASLRLLPSEFLPLLDCSWLPGFLLNPIVSGLTGRHLTLGSPRVASAAFDEDKARIDFSVGQDGSGGFCQGIGGDGSGDHLHGRDGE